LIFDTFHAAIAYAIIIAIFALTHLFHLPFAAARCCFLLAADYAFGCRCLLFTPPIFADIFFSILFDIFAFSPLIIAFMFAAAAC